MLGWEVIPRIGFGNFTVSPHGLGIALGYFAGTMLLARRARERGFSEDHAWNAAALSVVGAILGARIAYIIGHFSTFSSPVEWLQIYKGGISLVGGLLGGFFAAYLYIRKQNLNFFELTDLGAPGIAIGIAIGRIGDLVIGDHLGKVTDGFWGWKYAGGELISPPPCIYPTPDGCIAVGLVVHQTALYDLVWSLIIFGILMTLDKKPQPRGFLTLTWASLYAVGRIATDFARVDKDWFGLGLTGSQLTSIVVLGVCSFFLFKLRQQEPAPAGVPIAPEPREEPAERPSRSRRSAGDTLVETPPAAAATGEQERRRGRTATAASAATVVEEKPKAQPRRKSVAETPSRAAEPEPAPAPAKPKPAPREVAAEKESVFKAARERRPSTDTTETERPKPRAPRDPDAKETERPKPSAAGRPKPAPKPKPKEEPEEDPDDFDWEP